MSECLDNQKQSSSNFRKLLQERSEKANPRCELTAEETKRLKKLQAIAIVCRVELTFDNSYKELARTIESIVEGKFDILDIGVKAGEKIVTCKSIDGDMSKMNNLYLSIENIYLVNTCILIYKVMVIYLFIFGTLKELPHYNAPTTY